ncbi:MAG: hypothetical protein Ct9H300mP28_23050 [Pseudomonadota bacterium]|nr:MAG: hypothetical protein Ct9H300mP28_23050 [Pseudomonadota bacterium]
MIRKYRELEVIPAAAMGHFKGIFGFLLVQKDYI